MHSTVALALEMMARPTFESVWSFWSEQGFVTPIPTESRGAGTHDGDYHCWWLGDHVTTVAIWSEEQNDWLGYYRPPTEGAIQSEVIAAQELRSLYRKAA